MADGRRLDLGKSVYELCGLYPDLIAIMDELGFHDIVRPGMLATAGRFMTLPKGAAMRGMNMGTVLAALRDRGFTVEGGF